MSKANEAEKSLHHVIPSQQVKKMNDLFHYDLYDNLLSRSIEAHTTSYVSEKEKNFKILNLKHPTNIMNDIRHVARGVGLDRS